SLAGGYDRGAAGAVAPYAGLGEQAVHEYCFAAGTLVLLADGTAKRIEGGCAGDLVLAGAGGGPRGGAPGAGGRRGDPQPPAPRCCTCTSATACCGRRRGTRSTPTAAAGCWRAGWRSATPCGRRTAAGPRSLTCATAARPSRSTTCRSRGTTRTSWCCRT